MSWKIFKILVTARPLTQSTIVKCYYYYSIITLILGENYLNLDILNKGEYKMTLSGKILDKNNTDLNERHLLHFFGYT